MFYDSWLKDDNFQNRASFLLLRMKVLADKGIRIFALDDPNMNFLSSAANGNKSGEKIESSSFYKKPPISSEIYNSSGIMDPKKNCLDLPKIFQEIGFTIITPNPNFDDQIDKTFTFEFYSFTETQAALLGAEEEAAVLDAEEEARYKAEKSRFKAEEEVARLEAEKQARLEAEEEARLEAEEEARLEQLD